MSAEGKKAEHTYILWSGFERRITWTQCILNTLSSPAEFILRQWYSDKLDASGIDYMPVQLLKVSPLDPGDHRLARIVSDLSTHKKKIVKIMDQYLVIHVFEDP